MPIRLSGRALSVAALAAALLLVSGPRLWAQQVPHVLVVGPLDNYGPLLAGLSEGLQSAGFTDASRIRIDHRNASSADEAKAAIGAAIDTGVDAIVTVFGPSTQAASAATTKIPIVFCPVADPVAAKFAASSDAPGGNLTGIASADAEASRQRLAAFRAQAGWDPLELWKQRTDAASLRQFLDFRSIQAAQDLRGFGNVLFNKAHDG